MPMRHTALFIIAASVTLCGQMVARRLEKRVKLLQKICVLFSCVCTKIEFTAQSAADIFSFLSSSGDFDSLPFVKKCSDRLLLGESFEIAWRESVLCRENTAGLRHNDLEVLLSFGSSFGVTDVSGQAANCKLHMKLAQSKLENAEKQLEMYSKPARSLGILVGAAVYIIFM